MKRNYSTAFNVAAGTYLLNSLKRQRTNSYGSYNLSGTDVPMAKFRKSRLRSRNGRSRTLTKRRKFGRGSRLVKRVRRIGRTLHRKGLNSIEIKYRQGQVVTPDTLAGPGAISTLMETGPVSANNNRFSFTAGTPPGTFAQYRIGGKVFLRHLRIRGLLQASNTAAAASEVYVTILILRVKDAQGSTGTHTAEVPYLQNVYEYIDSTSLLSTPPNSQNGGRGAFVNQWNYVNARFKDDFHVLKKKTYRIGKFDGNPPQKVMFKYNIPVFKPCHWDENNNPQDGHIYIYYWADQITATDGVITNGDRPTMWLSWRCSFTDC